MPMIGVHPPRKLPCVNDLYRLVSYLMDLMEPAGIRLDQLVWRVHPAMWSQMIRQSHFKDAIAMDYSHPVASWRMFGIPVVLDTYIKHPTLTITMDCIQEYETS